MVASDFFHGNVLLSFREDAVGAPALAGRGRRGTVCATRGARPWPARFAVIRDEPRTWASASSSTVRIRSTTTALRSDISFRRSTFGRVEACIGDWIVYYEPRKIDETRGYFAMARVEQVIPDPKAPGMHLALIEPGSYLDFPNPVPFSGDDGVVERGVLNSEGRISGRAQSAVRPLSASDFGRIVSLGLREDAPVLPRVGEAVPMPGLHEEQEPFTFEQTRERISYLSSRIVRDRVFRRTVLRAYESDAR